MNFYLSQVPNWTEEDVQSWVKRAGFADFIEAFKESRVDGDLLLRLSENEMKEDLGITNGIRRKRFIRELNTLKKCADYTCKDRHGIVPFLAAIDKKFYAYGMIDKDMNPDLMKRLNSNDLHDLLKEAGVDNAVHRHQIIEACKDDFKVKDENDQSWDVYISNAGLNHGTTKLASLLAVHLQLRGLSVFNPAEHLDLSQRLCDSESCVLAANADALKQCKNLVLVLGDGALDGCINDTQCKNKLHREIKAALQEKERNNCFNIIPVVEGDFQFPEAEELPEDIRQVGFFNSVRWVHDYQEACVDKLERFIRGETFVKSGIHGSRSPNLSIPPTFSTQTSRSRTDSGRSSPSRLTPIKIYRPRADSCDSAISP